MDVVEKANAQRQKKWCVLMGAFCDLVAEVVLKGEGREGRRGDVRSGIPRSVCCCIEDKG